MDPIADFLTRIRNAQMARKTELHAPYSRMKHEIAKVMVKNKFLQSAEKVSVEGTRFPSLHVKLVPKPLQLTRCSKPGQRQYVSADQIYRTLNGFGISILSTSQGVMTGYQARTKNIGGEVLCEVSPEN